MLASNFSIIIKIIKLLIIKTKILEQALAQSYKKKKFILRLFQRSLQNILNMNLSLILFLIGILGFILNRKNIILMIISIEIMLLAVTLLILISSFNFDDNLGQTFGIYIIAIAGAESVIGLSILVAYYRLRGSISLKS